jgi:hypothetical protein
MDMKTLARFVEPDHRVSGDRRESARNRGAGYAYLHCVVDDNSRFAHVELHPREDAETNARTLERALAELAELGLEPPEAVMTDRPVYTRSHHFREHLSSIGTRHPPYTPRWNGKIQAFINTLQVEWAYARLWESSGERARALSSSSLLQPVSAAQLARRPTSDKPGSQRPWAAHPVQTISFAIIAAERSHRTREMRHEGSSPDTFFTRWTLSFRESGHGQPRRRIAKRICA